MNTPKEEPTNGNSVFSPHRPQAKSCILVLLDGLGDRAYKELNNRTPLQAAKTPNLDKLAAVGSCGLFHPDKQGVALPSENAHFAIFGYRQSDFPGRGILEALGADMHPKPGDVAVLAHFVYATEKDAILYLKKNRPETRGNEANELSRIIAKYTVDGLEFSYTQTKRLDGIITIKGKASALFSDTDPIDEKNHLIFPEPLDEAAGDRRAELTSKGLRSYLTWCYQTLCSHEINHKRKEQGSAQINALVTQRPGQLKNVEPFFERWGLRGLSISSGLMYHGLCQYLGIDVVKENDTENSQVDLETRLACALKQRSSYDFIHVHTKAPDHAAHTKNPHNKVAAIEAMDRALTNFIKEADDGETIIMVTGDHSTPSKGPQIHSGELVPFMMRGPGIRQDNVAHFNEIDCAGGCLGRIAGDEFMPVVINSLDRAKLQGLRDSPKDRPYWPAKRKPFNLKNEDQ